jgi:hypothetical protein
MQQPPGRRHRRGRALLLLAVVVLPPAVVFRVYESDEHFEQMMHELVEAPFVIPAGHEDAVIAFLQPLRLGGPVIDGWMLQDVDIDRSVIRLHVAKPGVPEVTVELYHRTSPLPMLAGGVALRAGPGTPPEVLEAVREALASNKGSPAVWMQDETANKGRKDGSAGVWMRQNPTDFIRLRAVLLAATIVLLVCTVASLAEHFDPSAVPPGALAMFAAVTALGAALRFTISPATFLHEYYHTSQSLPNLLSAENGGQYGLAGPSIYAAVNRVFGGQERAVFSTNAVLASATVPGVVLLDLSLRRSWPTALLSGLLVALLPMHLRFSASEELWIPGICFAVWSLAAWAAWLRRPDGVTLAVAVVALGLAMQNRPELLALPAAHVLLVFVLRPPREWLRTLFGPATLVALAGLALLLARRGIDFVNMRGNIPSLDQPGLGSIALADPTFTPDALLILGALGALVGLVRRPRETLWLAVLTVMFALIPAYAFGNAPCRWRTQILSTVFAGMLAGGVLLWVDFRPIRRWGMPIVFVAAAVWAALGLWQRLDRVTELLDAQLEWAFLRDTVAKLPAQGDLIAYFNPPGAGQALDWIDPFPSFLLDRYEKKLGQVDLREIGGDREWPVPRPGLLYYQGMDCWGAMRQVSFSPMRDRCMEIADRYELRPLEVTTLDTTGYSHAWYATGPYRIGFFEVTGVRGTDGVPNGERPE